MQKPLHDAHFLLVAEAHVPLFFLFRSSDSASASSAMRFRAVFFCRSLPNSAADRWRACCHNRNTSPGRYPTCERILTFSFSQSMPKMLAAPDVFFNQSLITCGSSLIFPAPFGPMNPKISPSSIARSTLTMPLVFAVILRQLFGFDRVTHAFLLLSFLRCFVRISAKTTPRSNIRSASSKTFFADVFFVEHGQKRTS